MSATEALPAGPKTERRRSRFRRRKIAVLALLFVACGAGFVLRDLSQSLEWTADYDRGRYNEIRRAIADDPQHLRGRPFDEVVRRFGLGDVPWDDAAIQQESGMYRIYHFRGFALHVTLKRMPPGVAPDSRERWTGSYEDLERQGVLWLASQDPFVRVDGIADGKTRMERYWKEVQEMCDRINAEMEKGRQTTAP